MIKRKGSSGRRLIGKSTVSLDREVGIGIYEKAPRAEVPSLDFDRVVNSYSIEAAKKRLLIHRRLFVPTRDYQTFQDQVSPENESRVRTSLRMPFGKTVMTWVLTLLTGLLCGVFAILILYCVEHIGSFRSNRINLQFQLMSEYADEQDTQSLTNAGIDFFTRRFGFAGLFIEVLLFNMVLAVLSAVMCVYYAPKAIGSGIPEVKAYLNGVCVPSFADVNTFLTKIIGTILSVSSGLVVGPEGPLVHIGAIIGQGLTKTAGLDIALRHFQKQHPTLSGWVGCAKTDAFGERKDVREHFHEVDLSRIQDEELSLLCDASMTNIVQDIRQNDRMTSDDDVVGSDLLNSSLPTRPGNLSRSNFLNGSSNSLPVTRGSLFADVLPSGAPGEKNANGENRRKRCNPQLGIFSSMVSSLSAFRNDTDRRDLISIGVATGFAAAFGAPVGGLLYSIEEASSFYTVILMLRTLAATALGTFMIAVYHGDLSKFSILSLGTVTVAADSELLTRFQEIPVYILIGACGGLVGAFFNATFKVTSHARAKHTGQSAFLQVVDVAFLSIVTTSVVFLLPFLLPKSWTCTEAQREMELSDGGTGFSAQFNCPPGEFNQVAAILLGSRDEALNNLLTDPTMFQARTLLMCGLSFLFLMIITFGAALPSGLFMPTLLTGSSLGGFAGIMIQRYYLPTVVPAHIALFGATAMLAGIQRTTISLCVIMMEATGQVQVLLPLIISVVVARSVADIFDEGFYHIIMHAKHYPFLEHHIKSSFDIPTVQNIMTSPVVIVHDIETAGTLETLLRENVVSSFPVVNMSTKEYVGLIRRDQIVALLECGIYVELTDFGRSKTSQIREVMQAAQKQDVSHALLRDDDIYRSLHVPGKNKPTKLGDEHSWLNDNILHATIGEEVLVLDSDDTMPRVFIPNVGHTVVAYDEDGNLVVNLLQEERSRLVDIGAAMNRGAYTVVQNTPLSKAYALFTALGLRTLCVLGENGSVVGIISRSNFNTLYMEKRTGLQMHGT